MTTEAISLKNPYPNGVVPEQEHLLESFISLIDEIRDKILAGERVYIRITAGERKGSIAYVKQLDPAYGDEEPRISHDRMFRNNTSRISNAYLNLILRWDKRRNRIKWPTYNSCEYLRGYEGPTVWEKFDKKAAEKKMLEETKVLDRDGNILKEGDRVLYINARYSCGASLDRGIIKKIRFKVQRTTYQSKEYSTVHVIIKNDNGEESDIKSPRLSVLKWEGNK